jgi:hypothetical protein
MTCFRKMNTLHSNNNSGGHQNIQPDNHLLIAGSLWTPASPPVLLPLAFLISSLLEDRFGSGWCVAPSISQHRITWLIFGNGDRGEALNKLRKIFNEARIIPEIYQLAWRDFAEGCFRPVHTGEIYANLFGVGLPHAIRDLHRPPSSEVIRESLIAALHETHAALQRHSSLPISS